MKTILAALAFLPVSLPHDTAPIPRPDMPAQYVVVAFDKGFTKATVIEEFRDIDDLEACVDVAQSSDEGQWTSCVPVTGEAEAYALAEPTDSIACLLAAIQPTDANLEACTGIPVAESINE